jgi:hypothetical protein
MNITPPLGIGDLLIIKMIQVSNKLDINIININEGLIRKYCENFEVKICFIQNLIKLLFPNTKVYINNEPINFYATISSYKFTNIYLYNYINNSMINFENKYSDCVVFHTKMRYDGLTDKFNSEILNNLNNFLENFKTSKKIIILGEKNIGENLETIEHKTISLYNNLLLLNKNNDVIDLTNDVLTCGNPNFNNFLLDIEIINKSLCNITFGLGGPFNMCKAFSENNISFIPFKHLSPYQNILNEILSINNSLVENIEDLNNRISKFTREKL